MDRSKQNETSVSSFRQFFSLTKKNWLLKWRRKTTLVLEFLLPLVFMLLMSTLASSGSSKTIEDKILESVTYPVPNLEFLHTQSQGINVLCYDNNLFNYCACKYDKPETSTARENIMEYYSGGFFQNQLLAMFLTSHSFEAFFSVCFGVNLAAQLNPARLCEYGQILNDLCHNANQPITDQSLFGGCGLIENSDWTVADGEAVIISAIQAAEEANAGVSIPPNSETCTATKIALIPMQSDWSTGQTGLNSQEQGALQFYEHLLLSIPATSIMNFTSEAEIEDYIKQSKYSNSPDIQTISSAIVFNSGSPNWEYTLRGNFTKMYYDESNDAGYRFMGVPYTKYSVDNSVRNAYSTGELQGRVIYPFNQIYYTSGLLTLQKSLDEFIMEQEGVPLPSLQYNIGFYPTDEFEENSFWPNVGDLFAIVLVLVLMYPVSNVIRSIVVDKELKLKEGMLQMGLGPKVYTLSWVFIFVVTYFVMALLLTIIGANSVFEYSDKGIVFAFFFLFFVSTIAFAFFLASFFQKARSASTYGSLIFFLTVFPYFGISGDDSSASSKLGACILPSTCFAVGTFPFVEYEANGVGVNSENINSTKDVNVSMGQVLGMFIVDTVIYAFLAWYVGQVIKSEWGTQKPWYFLFTKSYWMPSASAREGVENSKELIMADETTFSSSSIEPVSESLKSKLEDNDCVALRGLTKIYRSANSNEPFKAVDNLNLTMYEGQITALLGHNGAGKTTTMNMLTGMIPVSAGRAFINGLDVNTQMNKIRENLGVCPQHDILYPDLTVTEHLRMFATFKGVSSKSLKEVVDNMIRSVGLVEKRNEKSSGLSGGQKRKLSVAIAFIGGSKVVFLDEPTSGMDPHSRRFTWDVIRKQQEGRIIVLTTHFMDEADLLGDRIAIMGHGELKCCGASLFLKGLYGVGYNLTIVKTIEGAEDLKSEMDNEKVKERLSHASRDIKKLVQIHVPKAKVLSDVGAEVSFQLPTSASNKFKELLKGIEDGKNELCIGTYGMSITTLEEVFIRVANGTEELENRGELSLLRQRSGSFQAGAATFPSKKSFSQRLPSLNEEAQSDDPNKKTYSPVVLSDKERFNKHVYALLVKRAITYKRDKKMICFTALAPAFFLLLGLLILLVIPTIDQPRLVLNAQDYNDDINSLPKNPIPYSLGCKNDALVCEYDFLIIDHTTDFGIDLLEADGIAENTPLGLNEWLLDNKDSYKATIYGAYDWNEVSVTSPTEVIVDVNIHTNYTGVHAIPTYSNFLSNAALKAAAGQDKSITVAMYPFPMTDYESGIDDNYYTFPTVLFLMVGFAFIPAAWCGYVVKERETKSKHQQVVSGVSLVSYWVSTYLWDISSFILTPPLVLILMIIFDKNDSIIGEPDAALACFLLILLWGPSNMGFTYCFSFFFTDHPSSMTNTLFVNWVFGLIAPLAIFFMLFFESVRSVAKNLKWILRLHPGFCLGDGLLNLGNRILVQFAFGLKEEPAPFNTRITGSSLIYMAIETIAFFVITVWLEKTFAGTRTISSYINDMVLSQKMRRLKDKEAFWNSDLTGKNDEKTAKKKKGGFFSSNRNKVSDENINNGAGDSSVRTEDSDVVDERSRILNGVDDVIQIKGLRKVFRSSSGMKIAVRNMFLGIPKGQCFALLGINGAGKTTTISTLCGEQESTEGKATLAGVDVSKDSEEVHRLIGYCPQFDALFETMTGREHLIMYARIKGIEESMVKEAVESKIREMDLVEYADKLAGGYSGGNKRKLSVAVAMLGGPEIVFLDEPSTGVDPVARRHMWDVISRIVTTNKQCALVLTTHSMEEAEALCQRIGIMVGGRLQCLGSAQHLKSKFGDGYQLEVTAALPSIEKSENVCTKLSMASDNCQDDSIHGVEEVRVVLSKTFPELEEEFSSEGRGNVLFQEVSNEGSMKVKDLAAWAIQESICMNIILFIATNFREAELLEKQGGKMRLSLPPQANMTLGTIFGIIEENRSNLEIGDYALGQTSLEQIFNTFAAQQAEELASAPGKGKELSKMMAHEESHQLNLA